MKYENKYVIGVTGGVGTGKSTISGYIGGRFNAEIITADELAKSTYEPDGPAYAPIIELFGEDILDNEKKIDRSFMARLVFNDPEKLTALNNIIHPLVRDAALEKIMRTEGIIVYEAALPREAHLTDICDEVWFVYASYETRIDRLMKNRGYNRARCEKMIESQLKDREFRALCDTMIDNDKDIFTDFSAFGKVDREMTRVLMKLGGRFV